MHCNYSASLTLYPLLQAGLHKNLGSDIPTAIKLAHNTNSTADIRFMANIGLNVDKYILD